MLKVHQQLKRFHNGKLPVITYFLHCPLLFLNPDKRLKSEDKWYSHRRGGYGPT